MTSLRLALLSAGVSSLVLGALPPCRAQTAPTPPDTSAPDQAVRLSPFLVNEDQDHGYVAANTVAGSRLNTPLSDTPAAISVFDSAFLNDIGALNTVDALSYILNGNRDFSDNTGLADADQYDFEAKIRGLPASATREYFQNPGPDSLDGFNTDRIDFARGPDSILYGVGNPGGIINTTIKQAELDQNFDHVQLRLGSWDDDRVTLDDNHALGDKLAVRINGVVQTRKSWQDFADLDLQAIAGAVTYRPFPNTLIQVKSEYDDRRQVLTIYFPTMDFMSPWLNAGRPIATSDSKPVAGTALNTSPALVYDPTSAGGGLMSWANTLQTTTAPTSSQVSGAIANVTNFSLIPRSVNLGGSGQSTNTWWDYTNASITQKIGPVDVELAYEHHETHRLANYVVTWSSYGAYVDPNPLLPNGSPNPNVGQPYVQTNPSFRRLDWESDAWRATVNYKLDLSRWHLGEHNLTGLLSRDKEDYFTDVLFLVNTTPAGNATYPLNEASANNRIYERTYLNLGSNNLAGRGAFDPAVYPIDNIGGVTGGFERISNGDAIQTTLIDTAMVADQSTFWNGRLTVTAGARNDVEAFYNDGGAAADPVTGLFSLNRAYYTENVWQGNTRTVGGVFKVLPWLGVFYNNSDDFVPQSQTDINNDPLGPKTGQDQDFGAKFELLQNRLYLTVTHYQLNQSNAFVNDTTLTLGILPVINDIWTVLNPANVNNNAVRDTVDDQGRGWEADLVANPLPNWTVMINGSQDLLTQGHALPRIQAYVAANLSAWQQKAGTALVAPYTGLTNVTNPTVASAIQALQTTIALDNVTSGEIPRGQAEYAANAFTAYTFRTDNAWLKGFTLGGGFNFRSRPVTGYDATNYYAPVFGADNVVFNALLGKSWKLSHGVLKVQLNVNNLFNNQNLLPSVKDNTGTYQYLLQSPRSWSVTTTYSF